MNVSSTDVANDALLSSLTSALSNSMTISLPFGEAVLPPERV